MIPFWHQLILKIAAHLTDRCSYPNAAKYKDPIKYRYILNTIEYRYILNTRYTYKTQQFNNDAN